MTVLTIWFWQRMVTPHMAHLAVALQRRGHAVTYVAEEEVSAERVALGWQALELPGVALRFASNAEEARVLVENCPADTIHLTQGLRSNGNVTAAQAAIRAKKQRHFVIMETVDERGFAGWLKPALYCWHLHLWRRRLDGILAIGATTPAWVRRLGPKGLRVLPFAYFLPELPALPATTEKSCFRFIFVGALIPRKQVALLLRALSGLVGHEFEVELVGDGPMRDKLEAIAKHGLPDRVAFRGVLPISEIPNVIANSDCLVLPSSHDGWGAVVSEALMVGTPVVCSSACGAHAIVKASGTGGVFDTFDEAALRRELERAITQGKTRIDDRLALRSWARCLGTEAGADYLEELLAAEPATSKSRRPPWEVANLPCEQR